MKTGTPPTARLGKLRSQFEELRIDAFLVTFQPHLRYLSGFSGSNGFGLVFKESAVLLTDGRYAEQVEREVRGWRPVVTQRGLFEEMQRRKFLAPGIRIGFDGNTLIFGQFQLLKKLFPAVKFLPRVDCIEKIAAVKDEAEMARIRQAVAITDRVFAEVLPLIQP